MAGSVPSVVAVVDDDARILESLESLLQSAGHSVRLFVSGDDLLRRGGFSGIDCLISDIAMPAMDGLELRRLAHAARPELPVILITGREELANQAVASGKIKKRVFQKPFDGKELLAAIAGALPAPRRKR